MKLTGAALAGLTLSVLASACSKPAPPPVAQIVPTPQTKIVYVVVTATPLPISEIPAASYQVPVAAPVVVPQVVVPQPTPKQERSLLRRRGLPRPPG